MANNVTEVKTNRVTVTKCVVCGNHLAEKKSGSLTCSDSCRQKMYRSRQRHELKLARRPQRWQIDGDVIRLHFWMEDHLNSNGTVQPSPKKIAADLGFGPRKVAYLLDEWKKLELGQLVRQTGRHCIYTLGPAAEILSMKSNVRECMLCTLVQTRAARSCTSVRRRIDTRAGASPHARKTRAVNQNNSLPPSREVVAARGGGGGGEGFIGFDDPSHPQHELALALSRLGVKAWKRIIETQPAEWVWHIVRDAQRQDCRPPGHIVYGRMTDLESRALWQRAQQRKRQQGETVQRDYAQTFEPEQPLTPEEIAARRAMNRERGFVRSSTPNQEPGPCTISAKQHSSSYENNSTFTRAEIDSSAVASSAAISDISPSAAMDQSTQSMPFTC